MPDFRKFDLLTQVATIIEPDAFQRTEIDGDEQDRAFFRAMQEKRRVDARDKARRILDLCNQQTK